MHFNKKFSLDVDGYRRNPKKSRKQQLKTAGKHACQRLPAFFWPIRDEQETRLKVSEEASGHFFFYQWTFEDLGEILFVLWTRKGKSLIFFHLFSMLRE